jgi:HD-like signal output (HDOD) protein
MLEKILEEIEALPPLPNSILEINRICDDPESSITDLAQVVKEDPMATATLLKAANSPLYSSMEVKTIDRAVSMFGKAATKAFVISSIVDKNIKADLSPYGISIDEFTSIARKRVSLMMRWYSRVSFTRLNILATTALLGNVGQLILAKDLNDNGKADEFKALSEEKGHLRAEEEIYGVNSIEVSAMILDKWELNKETTNSIKYAASLGVFNEAPKEIAQLALANFIVFDVVKNNKEIFIEDLDETLHTLEKNNLKTDAFKKAIETINLETQRG